MERKVILRLVSEDWILRDQPFQELANERLDHLRESVNHCLWPVTDLGPNMEEDKLTKEDLVHRSHPDFREWDTTSAVNSFDLSLPPSGPELG